VPAPEVGRPLPRAEDAWSAPEKWTDWILAERGHLHDWRRVFGEVTSEMIWEALATGVPTARVVSTRPGRKAGLDCRVDLVLTLNQRTATVRSIWHYAHDDNAPKLVTAFPTT
jgi:hypothetical protein